MKAGALNLIGHGLHDIGGRNRILLTSNNECWYRDGAEQVGTESSRNAIAMLAWTRPSAGILSMINLRLSMS